MTRDRAAIAPLSPTCQLTIVIPARNEANDIVATLRAATRQRDRDGRDVPGGHFDVVLYCNDCDDRTAEVARRFAATSETPVHVVVAAPDSTPHVGAARRAALDLAADRYLAAGRPGGIVASTDADTIVAPTWVAATLAAMTSADAVAGFVTVAPAARAAMPAAVRDAYDRDVAYRRLLGRCEAELDPRPHDPWPRHDSFNGASFAVSSGAYVRAGRLPVLPALEDQAMKNALERSGARIRHSLDVVVATSARGDARVDGGFGSFLERLGTASATTAQHTVRSSRATLADARARALLRRYLGAGDGRALDDCCAVLRIERSTVAAIVRDCGTQGPIWERLLPLARFGDYPDETVTAAIASLEAALRSDASVV